MLSIKHFVAAGLCLVMETAGAQAATPCDATAEDVSAAACVDVPATKVVFIAKCTFDGNPAMIDSVTVEGNYPTAESRVAAAQAACKPIIERANLECSLDENAIQAELLSLVDDDTQRSRRAHLREQLKAARVPRPAYCQ